jgi:hypothetical protein
MAPGTILNTLQFPVNAAELPGRFLQFRFRAWNNKGSKHETKGKYPASERKFLFIHKKHIKEKINVCQYMVTEKIEFLEFEHLAKILKFRC